MKGEIWTLKSNHVTLTNVLVGFGDEAKDVDSFIWIQEKLKDWGKTCIKMSKIILLSDMNWKNL